MKIITGATESAHVTANNAGEFNQSIWGNGLVVLANGSRLGCTVLGSTSVSIADGDLVFQGRHGLIEPGQTETVSFTSGAAGYNRIDLICIRYEKDNSGYESMSLVVKQGTQTTGNPTTPSYTEGDIRGGAMVAEAPLYELRFRGVNVEPTMIPSVYNAVVDQLNGKQPLIPNASAISSVLNSGLTAEKVVVTNNSGKLAIHSLPSSKLSYLANVNDDIQTQLDAKQKKITGSLASATDTVFSANKVIISSSDSSVIASNVTSEELNALSGVVSNIQEQLDAKTMQKGNPFNPNKVVVSDGDKKLITSSVTDAEIARLSGVDFNIKTEIDKKVEKGSTFNPNKVTYLNGDKQLITSSVTNVELGYLSGVNSNIQSQIDSKTSQKGNTFNANQVVVSDGDKKLITNGVTSTELGRLSGVTSNIKTDMDKRPEKGSNWTVGSVVTVDNNQKISTESGVTKAQLETLKNIDTTRTIKAQLDAKQDKINGGVSTALDTNFTNGSRVLISNNSKKLAESSITTAKLGYLSDVTSNIQSQINNKANKGGYTPNRVLHSSAGGNIAETLITDAELVCLSGVTSAIQTQLNAKLNKNKIVASEENTTSIGTGTITSTSGNIAGLGAFSLDAGKYLVTFTVEWGHESTNGGRYLYLSDTYNGEARTYIQKSLVEPAYGGSNTIQTFACILCPTATKEYFLLGMQNSGSNITVKNIRYGYIGIKD